MTQKDFPHPQSVIVCEDVTGRIHPILPQGKHLKLQQINIWMEMGRIRRIGRTHCWVGGRHGAKAQEWTGEDSEEKVFPITIKCRGSVPTSLPNSHLRKCLKVIEILKPAAVHRY